MNKFYLKLFLILMLVGCNNRPKDIQFEKIIDLYIQYNKLNASENFLMVSMNKSSNNSILITLDFRVKGTFNLKMATDYYSAEYKDFEIYYFFDKDELSLNEIPLEGNFKIHTKNDDISINEFESYNEHFISIMFVYNRNKGCIESFFGTGEKRITDYILLYDKNGLICGEVDEVIKNVEIPIHSSTK